MSEPLPRLGTPRTHANPTLGGGIAEVAHATGQDLMPWQRHVADVAGEVNPATGKWARSTVGLVVGRQQGKSYMVQKRIEWALLAGRRVAHLAQGRALVEAVFLDVARAFAGPLAPYAETIRKSNGSERIETTTGGVYRVFAARPDSVRGFTADDLIVDEARELRDWSLIAAARPLLTASPNPQTWYLSSAGHLGSVVLNAVRDRGREGDPSLAYFEYSPPPDADPGAPETWAHANPALGHTTTPEFLAEQYAVLPRNEFLNEHAAMWVDVALEYAIAPEAWAAVQVEQLPDDPDAAVWVGVSADPTTGDAAAAVAEYLPDGTVGVSLLSLGDLSADDLKGLRRSRPVRTVAYDPATTRHYADTVDALGLQTLSVGGAQWANASAHFADLVAGRRVVVMNHPTLDEQVAAAPRKTDLEGRWRIVRDDAPIPALLAVVRAVWAATRPTPTAGAF